MLTKCSVIFLEGIPNTDDDLKKIEASLELNECHKINRLYNELMKVCNAQVP